MHAFSIGIIFLFIYLPIYYFFSLTDLYTDNESSEGEEVKVRSQKWKQASLSCSTDESDRDNPVSLLPQKSSTLSLADLPCHRQHHVHHQCLVIYKLIMLV